MSGTKQAWRHICFKAVDLSVTRKAGGPEVVFVIPHGILVQGCDVRLMDVILSKRFQGAYNCIPEIVAPPTKGVLEFTGTGWAYRPTGAWVADEFTYVVKANYLVSNIATCKVMV